ncbi:GPW/gp25 family protein [Sphingomonas sp. 28-63-12]|uniref:GPW/gp25 family protein n=1 Tax=Sphingomonas sp. 28-63-12 TaxID=1970434 RepID=UPI000BCFE46F|nr:MAG: hypothetical protein B7Y47_05885 [Sphingomonas sp. 28-63-12]
MRAPGRIANRLAPVKTGHHDEAYPGFLGRGWSFPPTFDRLTNSVVMASAETDIRQALWIILSTALGERVMLATFGCDLLSKVFTTLTTTSANEIAAMVTRAIIDWEPRVEVNRVTVTAAELSGWIDIDIEYTVRATNSRSNLVFPFYNMEATLPPPPS